MKKIKPLHKTLFTKVLKITKDDIVWLYKEICDQFDELNIENVGKIRVNDFTLDNIDEINQLKDIKHAFYLELSFVSRREIMETFFDTELITIKIDKTTGEIYYLNEPQYLYIAKDIETRINNFESVIQRLSIDSPMRYVALIVFGILSPIGLSALTSLVPFKPINLVYLIPLLLMTLYGFLVDFSVVQKNKILINHKNIFTIKTPIDIGSALVGGIIGLVTGIISTLLINFLVAP